MRHLGVTLEHASVDQIAVTQKMEKKGDKLIELMVEPRLYLTYAQAYDLKDQLDDFLGDWIPDGV
jgi:hypothetical protein